MAAQSGDAAAAMSEQTGFSRSQLIGWVRQLVWNVPGALQHSRAGTGPPEEALAQLESIDRNFHRWAARVGGLVKRGPGWGALLRGGQSGLVKGGQGGGPR